MSATEPPVLNDRYEIQQRIGRGGMADVFLARDQLLDRPVAIKVLFPEYAADPNFVERFRREAQAAANLNHPNIVGVYDWGKFDGTYFMAMEFIQGRTLADILRANSRLTPMQATDVASEVAAALGFAHRNGVVHRDVKPANILIGHDGRVKVADFGIARALNSAAEQDLTQAGSVMGTASYFSPEQAQGAQPDPRSDLYSLGIVMYEMVAGKPPFTGENPVAIAYKQVHNAPQPLNQIVEAIPRPFEAIVAKLLAKNPAVRYPTAEALRDDLRRFKDGQQVNALAGAAAAAAAAGAAGAAAGATGAAASSGVVAQTPPPSGPVPGGPAATAPPWTAGPSAPPPGRPAPAAVPAATAMQTAQYVPGGTPYSAGKQPQYYEAPRRTSGVIIAAFFLLAALVAGGVLLYRQLTKEDTGTADEIVTITVPEVRGVTIEEAERILREAGLEPVSVAEPNEDVEPNIVYEQDPTPDQIVDEGVEVTLTYNPAPDATLIEMPGLLGLSLQDATTKVVEAGLDPANITVETKEDDVAKADTVLDQAPPKGEQVAADSAITLTVAISPSQVIVPPLADADVGSAEQQLADLGLKVRRVDEVSDTVAKDRVIRTEPPSGTPLDPGDRVTIVVSLGKEQVSVPDLSGFSENQARQALQDLDLKTKVGEPIDLPPGDVRDGKVVLQNPARNTQVDKGSTITIRLGKAAPLPPTTTSTTTTTTTTTVPPTTAAPPSST